VKTNLRIMRITITVLLLTTSQYVFSQIQQFRFECQIKGTKYSEASQKQFIEDNSPIVGNLDYQLSNVPIDRCHDNNIIVEFTLDKSGNVIQSRLSSTTKNSVKDSLILFQLQIHDAQWNVKSLNNDFDTLSVSVGIELDFPIKNCNDDNFFYEQGVNELNNKNYKKAIYSFSEALKSNPYDLYALNNLGISYIYNTNPEKGCQKLKEAITGGFTPSLKAFSANCQNINIDLRLFPDFNILFYCSFNF
jgi:hypothetical protein